MTSIAGLDLSLAGTAAVILDGGGRPARALVWSTVQRDQGFATDGLEIVRAERVQTGDVRADYLRTAGVADAVRRFLRRLPTGSVVGIEDHAFGAQGRAVYQLGHLHGMIRRDVVGLGCRFLLLGVGEVKQAATGDGAASKATMVDALGEVLGGFVELDRLSRSAQEALADAYAVARLAWWIEYARAHADATLPPSVARLVWPTKKRPGLIDRPAIG